MTRAVCVRSGSDFLAAGSVDSEYDSDSVTDDDSEEEAHLHSLGSRDHGSDDEFADDSLTGSDEVSSSTTQHDGDNRTPLMNSVALPPQKNLPNTKGRGGLGACGSGGPGESAAAAAAAAATSAAAN